MEEFLKIGRDSNFYLQGNLVTTQKVGDLNDYLTQLLGFYTTLEEGITLSELIHAFYGMRKFITNYFSEEYEVARAFATATKLEEPKSKIVLYKSFRIEPDDFMDDDEFVYILQEVRFEEPIENDKPIEKLGDLPVFIDNRLEFRGEEFSFDKNVKFTLLDVLTCVFEELVEKIREGKNIKA